MSAPRSLCQQVPHAQQKALGSFPRTRSRSPESQNEAPSQKEEPQVSQDTPLVLHETRRWTDEKFGEEDCRLIFVGETLDETVLDGQDEAEPR
jgi:hypothetical protein